MRRLSARQRWAHKRWHKRWPQRFRHSLRWRLVALFLMLAVGTVVVFVGGTRLALGNGFELLVKPLLSDYVDRLAGDLGSPPDVERAKALVVRLPLSVSIDGPDLHWSSHPDHKAMPGEGMFTRTGADGYRVQFGLGDMVWKERHPWGGIVPLIGLLLLTVVAYSFVRRLFRPLDDIRAGALRYGEGDFSASIPVRRSDELGDLATQVNAMATGLHGMLKGQRALLLAISHELRSPLTRARLNAELSTDSAERQALLRDLALMSELITDLLESERLAAGPAALKREATDLNTLVREVVATGFGAQPLQLSLGDDVPPLLLDRPRATMLVRNLIDNAVRHGSSAGEPVFVSTRLHGEQVRLVVRDHGHGVPEDQLSKLAEPFYRPDTARTRSAGGVGLGLYLCRLVAQSHGGTLVLRNASPGLEVEVRWPV